MSGSYYEIFIKQFVQTLAQLSAAALTTSVAVPLYNFYIRRNTYEKVNQKEDIEEDLEEDLEENDLRLIADLLLEFEIDAVIATNTTISRTPVCNLPHGNEEGGLSGSPVLSLSNQTIHHLFQYLQNRIPIIGVGGILSGEDVRQKIDVGASLVQLYTGLIYKGPKLIRDCVRAFE